MTLRLLFITLLAFPATLSAETRQIDPDMLPKKQVHDTADLTVMAVDAAGRPAVVLLDLAPGVVVPPHATESGLRLLTVISGDLSWGNGDAASEKLESIYPAGSFLAIPEGAPHWLAARNGAVRLQLVTMDDETPVPALLEQLQ